MIFDEQHWAGRDATLIAVQEAYERVARMTATEQMQLAEKLGYSYDDEDPSSRLLSKQGSVGVISIRGPLTNSDRSWMNAYMGTTGYPEIRAALVEAAKDSSIQSILLDVSSGGGAVSGVSDTAKLIQMVGKHKKVVAYADGVMASAAYWLGSSASKVYASDTADVGSVGVINVHTERTGMMEQIGLKATVMRAGKYKALGHPMEAFTEEAKAQWQAGLDAVYSVFVQHVADARGVTYAKADSTMAQGREFVGEAAVGAGLVDGIATFDEVLAQMQQKGVDNSPYRFNNSAHNNKEGHVKKTLTEQDLAALAAGGVATAAAAGAAAEVAPAANTEITDPAAVAAAAAAAGGETAPAAAAPAAAAPAAVASGESEIVAFLRTELQAANSKVAEGAVELAAARAQLAAQADTHAALEEIARGATQNMHVALGGAKRDLSAMSGVALVSEHKRLSAEFVEKFKVGGVSAEVTKPAEAEAPAVSSDVRRAAVAATRFNNKKG
jgi:signal peptide peptidase SppA